MSREFASGVFGKDKNIQTNRILLTLDVPPI